MPKHPSQNEKGLTLIEILASTLIASLVLVLIMGIWNNSIKAYDFVSNHNTLRQEANIIINQLSYIHRTNKSYECKVTYNPNSSSLFINNQKVNENHKVFLEMYSAGTKIDLTDADICAKNPVSISLVLTSAKGRTYKISTTFKRITVGN